MSGKLRHAERERALRALATEQHGVVSHRQLLGLGFGVRWIERRFEEGLRRPRRGPIHVNAFLGWQGTYRRSGIWLHHCKLRPEETTVQERIPVTTVARTLFDFAEVAPYEELTKAAEAADRRNLLRVRELESICERGRGRRALRPTRRLLTDLGAPAEGRSPLEIRFAEFLRKHGIPAPAQNVLVLGHEVDAL